MQINKSKHMSKERSLEMSLPQKNKASTAPMYKRRYSFFKFKDLLIFTKLKKEIQICINIVLNHAPYSHSLLARRAP